MSGGMVTTITGSEGLTVRKVVGAFVGYALGGMVGEKIGEAVGLLFGDSIGFFVVTFEGSLDEIDVGGEEDC